MMMIMNHLLEEYMDRDRRGKSGLVCTHTRGHMGEQGYKSTITCLFAYIAHRVRPQRTLMIHIITRSSGDQYVF
jgi:hypothetical protein